jgi:hypothetical protein
LSRCFIPRPVHEMKKIPCLYFITLFFWNNYLLYCFILVMLYFIFLMYLFAFGQLLLNFACVAKV